MKTNFINCRLLEVYSWRGLFGKVIFHKIVTSSKPAQGCFKIDTVPALPAGKGSRSDNAFHLAGLTVGVWITHIVTRSGPLHRSSSERCSRFGYSACLGYDVLTLSGLRCE